MLEPGREVTFGSGYRYGFNGQEKDNEISGNGNSYTAEFWEYDARLGRRWNLDPKPNRSFSPYATFEDDPIWHTDKNGDTTSPSSSAKNASNTSWIVPKYSFVVGSTGLGPFNTKGSHEGTALILPTYGSQHYYGSVASTIDEPNSFIQFLLRLGGKKSNLVAGAAWFKEKTQEEKSGYKVDAQTNLILTIGKTLHFGKIGKHIEVSANFSIGGGIVLGAPQFTNDANGVSRGTATPGGPKFQLGGDPYYIVGYAGSAISRVDVTVCKYLTFSVATIINHVQTSDVSTSIGTQKGSSQGSVAISAGIGFSFGGR